MNRKLKIILIGSYIHFFVFYWAIIFLVEFVDLPILAFIDHEVSCPWQDPYCFLAPSIRFFAFAFFGFLIVMLGSLPFVVLIEDLTKEVDNKSKGKQDE